MVSVAIERYLAVCRPHHYREVQSNTSRSLIYILPSLLMAVGVNSSRYAWGEDKVSTTVLQILGDRNSKNMSGLFKVWSLLL